MSKFVTTLLVETLIWGSNVNDEEELKLGNIECRKLLASELQLGAEILQAIPFSTRDAAGIRYILRRVTEE